MRQNNVSVAFFTLQYHDCVIEIAYSLLQRKFIFAIQGTQLGFTCCININGYLNGYIDNTPVVDELSVCSGRGVRDPNHFYEHLDIHLPDINFVQSTRAQYVNILANAVRDNENNIYFNTWMNVRISKNTGQYEKTVHLLGAEVAEYCWNNNITPVYCDTPNIRTFDVAVDYENDYNVN
jgi:hypothetical protein